MPGDCTIAIEVVWALPERQRIVELRVPKGTTAAKALELSGVQSDPNYPQACALGIYGRIIEPHTILKEGDRVEIYRKLLADPKQARRRRAVRKRR